MIYYKKEKTIRWTNNYLGCTLTLMSIFEIEQAITTLSAAALLQILEEGVVSRVARSDDFNVYLPLIFDVEDHISMLFVFLYLLVRRLANVRDCHSRCLMKHRETHITANHERNEINDDSTNAWYIFLFQEIGWRIDTSVCVNYKIISFSFNTI